MKCVKCGDDFNVDEARRQYNDYVFIYNNVPEFKPFNLHFNYDEDFIAGERECSICARDWVEEEVSEAMEDAKREEFPDEDYEPGENDEALSVYDAALIWASNGKDEDYTFGYTEEELEEAL